jgi:hypothetical protein
VLRLGTHGIVVGADNRIMRMSEDPRRGRSTPLYILTVRTTRGWYRYVIVLP